jgi:hypothetical protein
MCNIRGAGGGRGVSQSLAWGNARNNSLSLVTGTFSVLQLDLVSHNMDVIYPTYYTYVHITILVT